MPDETPAPANRFQVIGAFIDKYIPAAWQNAAIGAAVLVIGKHLSENGANIMDKLTANSVKAEALAAVQSNIVEELHNLRLQIAADNAQAYSNRSRTWVMSNQLERIEQAVGRIEKAVKP